MIDLPKEMKGEFLKYLTIQELCLFSQVSKNCQEAVNAIWKTLFLERCPNQKLDTEDCKILKDRVIVITLFEQYNSTLYTKPEIFKKNEDSFSYEFGKITCKDKTLTIIDDMKFAGWPITKCTIYKNAFYVYLSLQKEIRGWDLTSSTQIAAWKFSAPLFVEQAD